MRKVLSVLLSITILLGYCAILAVPVFADTDENISSATEICEHSFGLWTDAGEGHTQTCSKCGISITESHAFIGGTVTVPPTCGTEGKKTVICHICGAAKEETVAPIGNHTLTDLISISDFGHSGTCSACGLEASQPHSWDAGVIIQNATCKDAGVQTLTCTGCQHSKTEPVAPSGIHTFSSLTPVDGAGHTGTCSVCNQEISESHAWDTGTVMKPATCIEQGEILYACTGCQYSRTEKLEMLTTHSWTGWQNSEESLHKRICTVCQLEESGEHSYESVWSSDEEIHYHKCSACSRQKDIKEHFPGPEATDTVPQICLVCQYVITPALNHTHEFAQQWSTDEDGHWYACSECEEKGEYADHDFEYDCDPDCAVCGYTRQTEHTYGEEWVSDGENHYRECTVCGDIQDKAAHTPDGQQCRICGHALADNPQAQETNPGSSSGKAEKKSFPVWGALVIAGVAALLIPVISFFQPDD